MLSINTNLSSLIAQNSLKTSTTKLNQAIERMTTGAKINHSKDNAANYSISTNMTTKIGAYDVAADNVAMGMDMVTTANENLNKTEAALARLRALAVQASNNTYGSQSLDAINTEANSIIDEINRDYNNVSYNGINLAGETTNFINDITRRDTSKMDKMEKVDKNVALSSGTYSISTDEDLAKLAEMTNAGLIGAGCEFVLANDIDLAKWCADHEAEGGWTPIGCDGNAFKGKFDGNGHVIKNLYIDKNINYVGLFGYSSSGSTIQNLGVENAMVHGKQFVAGLIGGTDNVTIINCYSSGKINSTSNYLGGLIGYLSNGSRLVDSYSNAEIYSRRQYAGGLVGVCQGDTLVTNCFSTGNVKSDFDSAGGLVGVLIQNSTIEDSYSTGDVFCQGRAGGFVSAIGGDSVIKNCYATGYVESKTSNSAFVDRIAWNTIASSSGCKIENCYALSKSTDVTSIYGAFLTNSKDSLTLENCYYSTALSDVPLIAGGVTGVTTVNNVSAYDSNLPFLIETDGVVSNATSERSLQVGINSEDSSRISVLTSYDLKGLSLLRNIGKLDYDFISVVDKLITNASNKQTELGSVSNRLESVLDEILIQHDNLVSSRSTIRDADMAELSSEYIKQQILQQASATLFATANQHPSIALSLL